ERLLDMWLTEAAEGHSAATELVADLKLGLRARGEAHFAQTTTIGFDGAVLAAALDQVLPASDPDEAGYRGVLLDVGSTDVSVVSTDRFLLVARLAVATSIQGPPVRVNVAPGTSIAWLRRRRHVD